MFSSRWGRSFAQTATRSKQRGFLRRRRRLTEPLRFLSAAAVPPAPQHPGVRQLGDPALLEVSVEVPDSHLGSPEFLAQVEKMETVMREAQGAGIAMCQVEGLPNLVSLSSLLCLLSWLPFLSAPCPRFLWPGSPTPPLTPSSLCSYPPNPQTHTPRSECT